MLLLSYGQKYDGIRVQGPATMRSTRWKVFGTAQSMPRNQKPAISLGISGTASSLPQLLGSGDDKKKLLGLRILNLHV